MKGKSDRQARLAKELRANLARRKAQMRERASAAQDPMPSSDSSFQDTEESLKSKMASKIP